MPDCVLTTLPFGIVLVDVKSLFRNRTLPVAFVSSTRLPGDRERLRHLDVDRLAHGGHDLRGLVRLVCDGLAVIWSGIGPIDVCRGVITTDALGSTRYARPHR